MTPAPLSDAALAAFREAREEAMPGEWTTTPPEDWRHDWATVYCGKWTLLSVNIHCGDDDIDEFRRSHEFNSPEYTRGPVVPAATAEFIAQAANMAVPLLDEINQLRERVASLDESLHYCNGVSDLAMRDRDTLRAEVAQLQAQVEGHCERIAKQSDLLSRKAER